MTQPLTPQQLAAALWQQQQAAQQAAPGLSPGTRVPVPSMAQARADAAAAGATTNSGPAPVNSATLPTLTGLPPGIGGAPSAPVPAFTDAQQAATQAGAPVAQPQRNLTTAGAPVAAQGATEMQPQQADPVAPLLRPQGGGAAHAVGFSGADKNYLGALNEQGQVEQTDAAKTANAMQSIADTFKGQNDALAAQSQQGLAEYQKAQQDNAIRRKQVDADAIAAQRRIEGKIADLEASGVDPNRYFQDQSTGQKILGGLAIGLGSFASHALGPNGHDSTNTALDIMNSAIARDVDSQKANLQKSLSVMSSRMNLNAQGFDQQKALLESERESLQSGYAVAMNEVAKRSAMFKDNADVQQNAAKITAGLQSAANDKVGQLNQQIYGIQKGAERVVGGAGNAIDPKYVAEASEAYAKEQAAAGHPVTVAQAHAHVLENRYGIKVPGLDTTTQAAPPKGGGAASARMLRPLPGLESNEQQLGELKRLLSERYLDTDEKARANTMIANLKAAGVQGLPENVGRLDLGRLTGSQAAAVGAAQADQSTRIKNLKDVAKNGAAGGEDEDNPAGLDEKDDDADK